HVQVDDLLALGGEVRHLERRVEAGRTAPGGGARLLGLERRQRRRPEREPGRAEEVPPRQAQGEGVVEEVHDPASGLWSVEGSGVGNPSRRFGVSSGGGSTIFRIASVMALICESWSWTV